MRTKWYEGFLIWVLVSGIALVTLTIVAMHMLDRQVIEQTGAKNLHAEFLLAANSVSRAISKSGGIHGDIHNADALRESFQDIFELRPGIRRLSVFGVSPDSSQRIYSSDPASAASSLDKHEQQEINAGRSISYFSEEGTDRGLVIAAPIMLDGRVVGALRGRFSLWKYEGLIQQQSKLARDVGIAAVIITSLMFLLLVRIKIHRPFRELLETMRRAEAGDLTKGAALIGPADLQEVAGQFNQLLARVRKALAEKERLLGKIAGFNETLINRIDEKKSELRRANMMLVEARVQAERSEKLAALGELSAVLAHELGNPLNSISGHLQLLLKSPDSREHLRHADIIRAELDRMVQTIRDVLRSTHTVVQAAPVDLNKVVRHIHDLIVPSLSEKGIVFKTELEESLQALDGDDQALSSLVFNLVKNAIQAMPEGGEVTVKTCHVIDHHMAGTIVLPGDINLAKGAVRLTFCDTGRGIPPDHMKKIFEPFFSTRHQAGGTGLGLAICHRVVSSLGGRMAVRSRLGHGTCFTIDFPVWNNPSSRSGRP